MFFLFALQIAHQQPRFMFALQLPTFLVRLQVAHKQPALYSVFDGASDAHKASAPGTPLLFWATRCFTLRAVTPKSGNHFWAARCII